MSWKWFYPLFSALTSFPPKTLDAMMLEEISQYEIGRRHLANIMGADPESFSQEDIDVSLKQFV